jgi:hypothetical protein
VAVVVKLHYVTVVTLQGPLMLDVSYFPKDPVLQYTQGHPCVKLISESILFGVASTSWWSNQQICTVKSYMPHGHMMEQRIIYVHY